jgi:3-methyladenine DNA glycosylase AlkC
VILMGTMDELIDASLVRHLARLLRQHGVEPRELAASSVADHKLRRRVDIVRDALVQRPGATRPIVDALYADESDHVRRSVANHVNDLSRDDPDLAADIVAGWLDQPDENTPRLARHALRTLVKMGHPRALELMGFTGDDFEVDGPSVSEHEILLGSEVHFTAQITNAGALTARTAIDFVLHFQKARGGYGPKCSKSGRARSSRARRWSSASRTRSRLGRPARSTSANT